MKKIEIDDDVFNFLQEKAIPFIDTPNTVLRRLLLGDKQINQTIQERKTVSMTTEKFVSTVLQVEFKEKFVRFDRYRWMFKSNSYLIYFQNFNKPSDKLWFRITEKPFSELKRTEKKAILCLTNPAESLAYIIPVEDIVRKVAQAGWGRPYLEVNIDSVQNRWVDLDWNIESYRKKFSV